MWYSLLSVGDFLILHLIVLPDRNAADHKIYTAWQGLLVIPFWYTVKIFVPFFERERSQPGVQDLQ